MKVGIIAPSPIPFLVGGAENLWTGLFNYLNENTSHQAELIKVPIQEDGFWSLVSAYRLFSTLRYDHFDLLITGKYPAWMIAHDNHVVYMLHKLRGLYDTYGGAKYESQGEAKGALAAIQRLLHLDHPALDHLSEMFGALDELHQDSDVPESLFDFPGPFIRSLVHFFDAIALHPSQVKRYYAISNTVKNRPGYFPQESVVGVLYPPTKNTDYGRGKFAHFFTASRLDNPKRVDLIVEAFMQTKVDQQLLIAGTGPCEEQLRSAAAEDPRVQFLGFVSDREIRRYYENALAVIFVPQDEDYGYIALEAMLAGKPVITVWDAGGPTELVENEVTGLICSPIAAELASRITELAQHPDLAMHMGAAGQEKAHSITWAGVTSELLNDTAVNKPPIMAQRRQKLMVLTTFPIYPPRGGGQHRVYHLYRALLKSFDIDVVSLDAQSTETQTFQLAPGMREIRVAKSEQHTRMDAKLSEQVNWVPVEDIAVILHHGLTKPYQTILEDCAKQADVIVCSHPFVYPAIEHLAGKSVWYEAQDVEADLKSEILTANAKSRSLVELTRAVERQLVDRADIVICCSEWDVSRLIDLYQARSEKFVVAPNGTCVDSIPFVTPHRRKQTKERLALGDTKICLFIGSWHGPNLEAVEAIFQMASSIPEAMFWVVGSSGLAFKNAAKQENVCLFGEVTEEEKAVIFEVADIALNPMFTGSGTNLKMAEYLAAGIPVVTTEKGIRGFEAVQSDLICIVDIDDFVATIRLLMHAEVAMLYRASYTTRQEIVRQFSWAAIGDRLLEDLKKKIA
jgi:glycosyltransferase involved in cell wall biosynthesis